MAENMPVVVEVWPLAADEFGIWLVSGRDGWRGSAVASDSEPHEEVALLLTQHAAGRTSTLVHSTSWRVDGPTLVLTYVVVLYCGDWIRDIWPTALPVAPELIDAVGKPMTHGPAHAPAPRYVDVLHHGLRHLRFLLDTDSAARTALTGMYE